MHRSVVLVLAAAVASALSVLAGPADKPSVQVHPNFSGEWKLDAHRSQLAPPFRDISEGKVHIEHRDPLFSFKREFVQGGEKTTVSFALPTDGQEVAGSEDGMPTRETLKWDGDTLVFLTIFRAPQGEARNTVRYALQDGGKTLIAAETFRGPRVSYDNLWVLSKSP